jgi:hypothetical protein
MPPIEKTQRSFAGGEISPSLYAHTDLVKYETGLRTCLNHIIQAQGGASNRAGMQYLARNKDHSDRARLIPFQFSIEQNYVLEFTENLMRVFKDGGLVLEPAKTITGITQADPGVVTSVAHGFLNGEWLWLESIGGMTELNSRFVKVANKTADTFELTDLDDNDIDTTGYTTYTTGGQASRIFELATTYLENDLRNLKYTQSADVMTICHPDYVESELSRTEHYTWSLDNIEWDPSVGYPENCIGTPDLVSTTEYKYKITAVNGETGEESLAGIETPLNITNITQADPGVVTVTAHGYADNDEVLLDNIVGMVELNGVRVRVNNATANTFEIQDICACNNDIDTTGYTAYVSGGTASRAAVAVLSTTLTALKTINLSWDAVAEASNYNVYRKKNGVFGFIGTTEDETFNDDGIEPDLEITPPKRRRPFDNGNYPGAVSYHKQRRIFGGSNDNPQTVYGTRVGGFNDMSVHSPIQDDDPFTFSLDSDTVQQIRHITSLKKLIIFTSGSTWLLKGGSNNEVITPSSVDADEEFVAPCSQVKPLRIGRDILYIEEGGKEVLYLSYSLEADGVDGDSLTLIASHLFKRREIVEWAYAEKPYSLIWCVTDTGDLLTLTYNRKQQVWAWARHETDGYVESVAVILEENENGYLEDYVYLSVRRTIGGATKRYTERLHSREFYLVEDCFFVDSGLSIDNWNSNSTSEMTLTGGTDWTTDETLTLTENGTLSPFVAGDVGRTFALRVISENGDITARCQFEITAYTSTTVVEVSPKTIVPEGLRAIATAHWSFAFTTLSGLDHLEGKTVSILADGDVEPQQVVTGGAVSLSNASSKAHAGLPYNSDLETLDVDFKQEGIGTTTKKKGITELTLFVEKSRAFFAGPDSSDLTEYPQRENEDYNEPTRLLTGKAEIAITPHWGDSGRIFIRQSYPLPLSILAVIPEVELSE